MTSGSHAWNVGLRAVRRRGLDDQDPRPPRVEVDRPQDFRLGALHIDLEKVDIPIIEAMLGDDMVETHGPNLDITDEPTVVRVRSGNVRIECGQAGAGDLVQRDEARIDIGNCRFDDRVSVSLLPQGRGKFRYGFDVEPGPASAVEGGRHRVIVGGVRADIDVTAIVHMPQRAPQDDIFGVLRIGDEDFASHSRHPRRRARCSLTGQSTPTRLVNLR